MRPLRLICGAGIVIAALGCSRQGPGPAAALTPTGRVSRDVLAGMSRDCLQYPTGARDSAGNDLWNADYVYFTVVDSAGQALRGTEGRPLAGNLLFSQLTDFMDGHPGIAAAQGQFGICAQRIVRHMKDGKVLRDDPYVTIDDFDLFAALAADRAARLPGAPR
jgi:hypothetical protein